MINHVKLEGRVGQVEKMADGGLYLLVACRHQLTLDGGLPTGVARIEVIPVYVPAPPCTEMSHNDYPLGRGVTIEGRLVRLRGLAPAEKILVEPSADFLTETRLVVWADSVINSPWVRP